jgi:formate dehydrogenase iron-sulfur subunit
MFGDPRGGEHPRALGRIEDHPWLTGQTRITFARCGAVDPLAVPDFAGLAQAREIGPEATIAAVTALVLRGRGGAGFPGGREVADGGADAGRRALRGVQRRRGR